ncbi:GNAT family N-acetyltransferase [Levilactobacillus spicheri]|nr:GNAT family N-acetyltransferase [Levilactobacillus spicheri]
MHRTWNIGIGVAQNMQQQGVGGQLMAALKAEARRQGIHRIELNVLATKMLWLT